MTAEITAGPEALLGNPVVHSLRIEYIETGALIRQARNPRTHSPEQVAQIAASIAEFGFTNPVLIDEGQHVIAGHGRLMAASLRGMASVPCLRLAGLTETQKRALVIADNKLALNAGWDSTLLLGELEFLQAEGFPLELTGFEMDEFEAMGSHGPGGVERPTLADRFMVPPFSVLNAREGWWQERKRAWLSLGIQSELGRGGTLATPPHPPTVTQNADGTLNYGGTAGQDQRFDRQRQAKRASPGGSARPAADYSKRERGTGSGRAL